MSDHDPQPSEPSASQPPDESRRSWRTDGSSAVETSAERSRERRERAGRSATRSSGEAVTGRANPTRPHSIEDVFALVTDRRRRHLLSALCAVDGEVAVSRLATDIEARSDGTAAADGQRRAIEISLVHDHLPRLASMDLITYDRDRRRVRPTAAFRRIEPRLRSIAAAGDRAADD